MSKTGKRSNLSKDRKNRLYKYIGLSFWGIGLILLLLTYMPIINAYISYWFYPKPESVDIQIQTDAIEAEDKKENVVFIDKDFGIYIPKINTNAKIIANVNPHLESEYIEALKDGVAHASGTSFPNQDGNVFLFAHSAVNFYEKNKYNVYFYLLGELEKNDDIYLSYRGVIYRYLVQEIKIINPDEIEYLGKKTSSKTLTLMTCWPAGMNLKRQIVTAIQE
jgi:LPXTG-site transpeptidase (sortase) family protein